MRKLINIHEITYLDRFFTFGRRLYLWCRDTDENAYVKAWKRCTLNEEREEGNND